MSLLSRKTDTAFPLPSCVGGLIFTKRTGATHCALPQVPQSDVGDALGLTVVAQHQVAAGLGQGRRPEAQLGRPVLQGVDVLLGRHGKDVEVVAEVGAQHHLGREGEINSNVEKATSTLKREIKKSNFQKALTTLERDKYIEKYVIEIKRKNIK